MKYTGFLAMLLVVIACKEKAKETVTKKDKEDIAVVASPASKDWELLFDGETFNGWHEYLKDEVSSNWKIEDGAMVFYPPAERPDKEIYDLVSDKEYTDFILSIDWKISAGGNSGVFWGIQELPEIKPYETGPEIQVIDNAHHPDGKNGTSHQSGALYDMVSPVKDATKPAGEWNTYVITIDHKTNYGSVLLNGEKVAEFVVHGPKWDQMVSKSKFADWVDFGKYPKGKIGVQDHGDVVAFKNIKIKQL